MSGCEGYGALARFYDRLNSEVDYKAWADFFEECFSRFLPQKPTLVLDLACGTGRMTAELSRRGYDMIGIDGSADMLSEAFAENQTGSILYLLQDMREFELYGTVGAITCCLDSLNYLLQPSELLRCFKLVHNYLDPNGLFLFDMNTPYKFREIYGNNAYVLEGELPPFEGEERSYAVYCGWQNSYSPETKLCDFDLALFEETENGSYLRSDEHQQERCYSIDEITSALQAADLELLGVYADFAFSAPASDTERWYLVARAKKA